MNNHHYRIASSIACLLLAANVQTVSASDFGYCTNSVERSNVFRVGSTDMQGLAIRLSPEKLSPLKGCTISSISAAFGSKRTTDGTVELFIATAPDAEPLVKQNAKISSVVKWIEFKLDNPYTITGDEPCLYIGYTGEISPSSSMLVADFTADSQQCSFAYSDGEWIDLYGKGCGNASIRFGIDNAPAITDLMMKPLYVDGYFKAENEYALNAQFFNFGTEKINSIDLQMKVGAEGEEKTETIAIDGLDIAPGEAYDFALPAWQSDQEGNVSLSLLVTGVNGGNDADLTDNAFAKGLFCYPASMERTILVEGFTGQACSNCPAGHANVHNFIESIDIPAIEVMHHSGYYPDSFTMNADYNYTYFYGSADTYAPAVMLNRTAIVGSVPVMNTVPDYLNYGYQVLSNTQPYVSLMLETDFDAESRELKVRFTSFAHTDLPSDQNVFNLMLVQDNLVARQTPYGDGYTHNSVFRGNILPGSWGIHLDEESEKAGGMLTYETTYILPEAIFSDYYDASKCDEETKASYTWATVPEDMRIVAYVSANGSHPAQNLIYNAIEVPLGGSATQGGMTGVKEIEAVEKPVIRVVDGRVIAEGCDKLSVFTIDGRALDTTARLSAGIYIVRASKNGKINTIKVRVK